MCVQIAVNSVYTNQNSMSKKYYVNTLWEILVGEKH